MSITSQTLTEFDLSRARLALAVHDAMLRARRIIPREGHLDVLGADYRAAQLGVRRRLHLLVTRDHDRYFVELCAEPHAIPGETRFTVYEAEVVIASHGSRVGLDLLPCRDEGLDQPARDRLHGDLCRVFGVGGEYAALLPDAREPEVRATLAGEG